MATSNFVLFIAALVSVSVARQVQTVVMGRSSSFWVCFCRCSVRLLVVVQVLLAYPVDSLVIARLNKALKQKA